MKCQHALKLFVGKLCLACLALAALLTIWPALRYAEGGPVSAVSSESVLEPLLEHVAEGKPARKVRQKQQSIHKSTDGGEIKKASDESMKVQKKKKKNPYIVDPAASMLRVKQVPPHHRNKIWQSSHQPGGDFPRLDDDRSPHSENWSNSIAICACMFQENTTDVREWLLYHKWLGVDHVYLTENSNPIPVHLSMQLKDFIDEGFVTLMSNGEPSAQQYIYRDCMKKYRHLHNWMAFIDLDEFIVLRNEQKLKTFLNDFKFEAALVMHWIHLGPAGRKTRPEHGGVLRDYQACKKDPGDRVKSIVNTYYLLNVSGNVHTFEYIDNMRSVDEHKVPIPWRYDLPAPCVDGRIKRADQVVDCRPLAHFMKPDPRSVDNIALFHYITRSAEDFRLKSKRGGGAGRKRDWSYFNEMKREASETGGICSEAAQVAAKCCNTAKYAI